VHRDVSPHNILIGTNGANKLVDFGVAKAMGRIADATSAGQLKGKFSYMSPEQAMAKPVDRRSDIFALGIVLFELTTGRRLFRGEHDAETLHLVANAEVPKPSSVEAGYPKALEDIVLKCLQREKDRRYQTALEVQRALEGYLKAERIVVARSGLAGLLKKVLGTRIEQRRRAVRAAIKAIDGASTTLPAVTGELLDPGGITSPSGLAEISGVSGVGSQPSGVSQPSGQSGAGSGPHSGVSQGAGSQPSVSQPGFSHSGVSHVSGPTGPTSAGFPQTIGASPPARGVPGWMLGLGAVALLLAGLVLAVALGAGRTTVVVQAPAAAPAAAVTTATAAASTTTAATPAPAATGSVPTLDFDSLPKGTTSPPQAGPKTAEPAAPRATATAAPVAPKPAAGAVGLPRENPYR
jgi:serine/threonine-protein kinase